MKASALEFRLRFLIHAVVFFLGFYAPWNAALHLDSIRTWQFLAAWTVRTVHIGFSVTTMVVLAIGILCALVAAILRTWGSAYLGASVVQAGAMHGDSVVAAGPYRHLRNPLYLGIIIHTFALALLMPPSGAIFCVLGIIFFELRLIAGEEAFLTQKLGEPYRTYCTQVPRLLPSITPRIPASSQRPQWLAALFTEIYFWGVLFSFAALGWRYNSVLILKGVIISLGISFITRASLLKQQPTE
jgi:protein-S-isoprenylcysteine O-methyltransferase Ste14